MLCTTHLWSVEKKKTFSILERNGWIYTVFVFSSTTGLKIMADQWTLSGQSGLLTGQKLRSLVMLTGHVDSYSWTNNHILACKS